MESDRITQLQRENERLKSLLQKHGISFEEYEEKEEYRPDNETIGRQHITLFHSLFRGRTDVYSCRSAYPSRKTGRIGYYPQIDYMSQERRYLPLTGKVLLNHLIGAKVDCSDVVGIYPLLKDNTCNFLVFDFDNHSESQSSKIVWEEVSTIRRICEMNHIPAYVERSRSGNGAHIWLFFDEPIPASLARSFGFSLLNKGSETVSLPDFSSYDRMIPAQDQLPINRKTGQPGIGNMIALPLQGQALKNGNSAFVDERQVPYKNQWDFLRSIKKIPKAFVEEKTASWGSDPLLDNPNELPWRHESTCLVQKANIKGEMKITICNQLFIEKTNLSPNAQNQLRRLAAFPNPDFYRKQAMGFSTFDTPRIVFCGYDDGNYICLPRGLKDELIEHLGDLSIPYSLTDLREEGKSIKVSFKGSLYPEQDQAVAQLLEKDEGILHATTAFGKTVIGANIISRKKVNTLILVHNTEIMNNWISDLKRFLIIDEEPPEYLTPTGRRKKRGDVIGTFKSSSDKSTGIVDIAMISSLGKPENVSKSIEKYGLVIMDECHHGASKIASGVLRNVKAKYFYGFTATPKRRDGLSKKLTLIFGPIRYQYTAKDRLAKTNLLCRVFPKTIELEDTPAKAEIHELYAAIIENQKRNDTIVNDAIRCIAANHSVLILTRFKEHATSLYQLLKDSVLDTFLLTGAISHSERREIRKKLHAVKDGQPFALIATSQLAGEGFNLPKLDTLILATPISWEGNLEQYVGRLHRDYAGKTEVQVIDYVDRNIPVFEKMFKKRLTTYHKIGYSITTQ